MRAAPRRALTAIAAAAAIALGAPGPDAGAALTEAERDALDMSGYRVTDRDGSFLDVAARIAQLRRTGDPRLEALREQLSMRLSCRAIRERPVLDGRLWLPSFYDDPKRWRIAAEPLLAFEESMSQLSGAWLASGDPYYARCIVGVLERWAEADALHDFSYSTMRPQAWYAIESMIFSAALSLSTVTGEIGIDEARRASIGEWLKRIAREHYSKDAPRPSCCNNHYYRRALYMTIVGVVTGDDELFRTGLRAPIAALHDLDERGALGLAMKRGWRALHYQNYSLLYLVTNMQVAHRQGYDLFSASVDGRTIADAVHFLLRSLANPYEIEGLPPGEQDLGFTDDPQYFSWMEIWLAHHPDREVERFVNLYRPIFNRGAGGHVTLMFKRPERPEALKLRQIADLDTTRLTAAEVGARHPRLEKWRRSR